MINKISDSELKILKVLWLHSKALTEREIIDTLMTDHLWHRATIQTLLRRLCKKDIVTKEKKDVFYFTANISEEEYTKQATNNLLNKLYGGNAKNLVSTMLSDNILSENDINDLKDYWQKRKNSNE